MVVTGPVRGGRGRPFGSPTGDLPSGYVMEEFLLAGVARSYRPVPGDTLRSDGRWETEPAGEAPYATRLYVVRPDDPARFNGVVIVNWQNVTAGFDLGMPPAGIYDGYAWVGVTAQRVGIEGGRSIGGAGSPAPEGLPRWDPERYGSLRHPGDAHSYDIFGQAGRAVAPGRDAGGIDPLGGLEPRLVLAAGASQSAMRLGSYLNLTHGRDRVFDGFLLLVHWGMCPPPPDQALAESFTPRGDGRYGGTCRIRDDGDVPVLVVCSESEALHNFPVRQPDSATFRFWELAGTAHVGAAALEGMFLGTGDDLAIGRLADLPRNTLAWDWVGDAALRHLVRWAGGGAAPPSFPPIDVDPGPPPAIRRDEHGNATGGLRIPDIVAATGRHVGSRDGDPVAALLGESTAFPPELVAALYPDRDAYLARWDGAIDDLLAAGLDLGPMAGELRARGRRQAAELFPGGAADLRPLPGPVPSLVPSAFDLADLGYVEEEYLVTGVASSYRLVGERTADGRWRAEVDATAPYRTRLVVRRPADAAAFSGTVLVEWLNVSAGLDASPDWSYLHRHLVRRGDAWAGVSAQKAGIDGGGVVDGFHLKLAAPERYGELDHPGDAFAFDMFSQAGRAVREALGAAGQAPVRVLAAGESQSAMFLTAYVNAVDPLAAVYDGYLVHGRPAAGAGFGGVAATRGEDVVAAIAAADRQGECIRADARVPVVVVQSETDVTLMGGGRAEQPDGDRVRLWEVAGAAHADTYLLVASHADGGDLPVEELARLLRPVSEIFGIPTDKPVNAGPQQHYVTQAALDHLDRWAGGGDPPPTAPRLARAGEHLVLDADGLATGGLRTPWVDVPTQVLSGLGQSGDGFAFLFGTTAPLDPARLAARYPGGRDDYLARFTASLDEAIAAGYILAADREEILGVAAAGYDGGA